jgi:hypothetical protein
MEEHGVPGETELTRSTYELLKEAGRRDRIVRDDSPFTPRFLPNAPNWTVLEKYPQVEEHVFHLSVRHAKLRRSGYRKVQRS